MIDRIRQALHDPVARNSIALMANTIVTSGLGYVFWIVVVRTSGAETNGVGAAFASGVQLVTLIASVGAAAALIEWLPRADSDRRWRQLVTTAGSLSLLTSLVGGLLVAGVSWWTGAPIPGIVDFGSFTSFFVSCLLFSIGAVVDYVCISEVRGGVLLVRNSLLTGLRIPAFLLGTVFFSDVDALFVAWAATALVSIVYAVIAYDHVGGGRTLRPDFGAMWSHVGRMRHSFVGQHLISVTAQVGSFALPLIVTARLSAVANGHFYITWMLGSVFFIISPAVATALFAETAAKPEQTAALARRSLLIILGLLVVPVVAYLLGGRLLLALFGGHDYAAAGTTLLMLLTLSAVPDAVTNVAVAVLRVTGRMTEALAINGGMILLTLLGSWFTLPSWGIVAVGAWWLAAQSIGAIWVLVNWRRISWAQSEAEDIVAEVAW